ncbi:hypothetical protein H9P43_003641 [Blastocladiella emersonii ATCC 22665]|nr:hypothetical protein H9P43_003641 [Blastocladiella emersonii ATCC 22665]
MKVYTHKTELDASWSDVTYAVFNKYPNPFASHVLQSDVLSRSVAADGTLATTRMHVKKGSVPTWAQSLFKANPVSYIVEDSTVNPHAQRMVTRTRNMDHRRFLFIEETQEVVPHPDKPGATLLITTARISSNLGWGLTARLEKFGISKFAENMTRSRQGLLHVLASVRSRMHPAVAGAAAVLPA